MDKLFDLCVYILNVGADILGMTYKEINIWIFCIIEPIVFFVMLFIIIKQYIKLKTRKLS
jgi:hypothetical protein